MKVSPGTLPELDRPKSLLRLEEGIVLTDASKMASQLAKIIGFEDYKVKERDLGDPYSTTKVLTLVNGPSEYSFVVKNFSDVRSLKWALLGFWAMAARRFSMTPMARLEREYRASVLLRAHGIKTPAIVAVAIDERIMVRKYVEGQILSEVIDGLLRGEETGLDKVAGFAELLVKTHAAGFGLGDTKASNVVISQDGLYLTDLEQAVEGGDAAWDLAEFLFYTAKLSIKEDRMERVARAFLASYAEHGDRSVIRSARKMKYFRPFQPFLTPGMSSLLRDLMADYC